MEYIQKNISDYLRSYRKINGITRNQLIEILGCSLATLEKYEHPIKPSPIANYIAGLKPLAKLRSLDIDIFVSEILSNKKKNPKKNKFDNHLVESISSLGREVQYKLLQLLDRDEDDISCFLDLQLKYLSKTKKHRSFIFRLLDIQDEHLDALEVVLEDKLPKKK